MVNFNFKIVNDTYVFSLQNDDREAYFYVLSIVSL